MPGPALWLRWSGRDLRARWVLVVALALVIALATGMAAGLGSVQTWRDGSADASFERLRFHDLRLALTEGSAVPAGSLRRLATAIPPRRARCPPRRSAWWCRPRSTPRATDPRCSCPGGWSGPPWAGRRSTRPPSSAAGAWSPGTRAVRSRSSRRTSREHYELPARGVVRISGGRAIRYVGQGRQPEYFVVTTPGAGFGAEANFAVLFMPLSSVQALSGMKGRVNELVLRLAPGADAAAIGRSLRRPSRGCCPGVGSTVTLRIAGGGPPPHLRRREERPALHQRLRLAAAGGRRAGGVQPDQPGRRVAAPGDRRRHGAGRAAPHPRPAPVALRRRGRPPGRGPRRGRGPGRRACCCAR